MKPVKYTQDNYRLTNRRELHKFTVLLYLLIQRIIAEHKKWGVNDLPHWGAMREKVNSCIKGLNLKAAFNMTSTKDTMR